MLYKHTPMQTSFGVIMLALMDGAPKVLSLSQVLNAYVAHQINVVRRRTEYRLRKARDRAHIVEGLLKALDMLDEVIALIRGSADVDTARAGLMAAPFEFSEIQANHILDMPLRRLTGLERQKLIDEFAELTATIAELESILGDDVKLRNVIKAELTEIRDKFGNDRRSIITYDPGDLDTLDLIDDDECVVTLSKGGYIKTVAADAFRRQGRGGRGVTGAKLRDEDYVEHLLTTTAHSYLLFFSTRGRVYRLRAHEIPMKERTARGTALVNLIALQPGERVQAIIDTRQYEEGRYLFFGTAKGVVKKTLMSEYDSSLRTGLIAINLREDDELVRVIQTTGNDDIFMVSRDGMTIRFSEEDVRAMGRATSGVRGMKLKDANDVVVGCDVARDDVEILLVTESGFGKRTKLDKFNRQGRGGQGVRGIKVTAARGPVVGAFMVSAEDEILVFSSAGNIIRMEAGEISSQGRDATGVRIARVGAGESVSAVAPVLETVLEAANDVAEAEGEAGLETNGQERRDFPGPADDHPEPPLGDWLRDAPTSRSFGAGPGRARSSSGTSTSGRRSRCRWRSTSASSSCSLPGADPAVVRRPQCRPDRQHRDPRRGVGLRPERHLLAPGPGDPQDDGRDRPDRRGARRPGHGGRGGGLQRHDPPLRGCRGDRLRRRLREGRGKGYASRTSCRLCDSCQAEISSAQVTKERRVRPSSSRRSAKGTVVIGTPEESGWTSHRQWGKPWSPHPVMKAVASMPSVICSPSERTPGRRPFGSACPTPI